MAGTALCYAASNVLDQVAMSRADSFVAALVKALLVVLFAAAALVVTARRRTPGTVKSWTRAARSYVLAGLVSDVVGTVAFFQAMKLGGINIATPMVQTWVIWAALGGAIFLRERVGAKTYVGLLVAVLGLVGLAWAQQRGVPFTPDWPRAIPFGLLGAVGWAGSTVLIRKGQTEGVDRYVGMFLQFLAASVGLAIVVAATGRVALFAATSLETYACIVGSAALSGILGMTCMYTALHLAPVNRVIPVIAGYPVLAAIAGAVLLGNYLSALMVVGVLVVSVGVVICQVNFGPRKERELS